MDVRCPKVSGFSYQKIDKLDHRRLIVTDLLIIDLRFILFSAVSADKRIETVFTDQVRLYEKAGMKTQLFHRLHLERIA